ncbi:C-type lectin LmsL-like [Puntigrus tetrazona]|uniref:C-type lectin LmsL-like n=1 Tax=Puntigrus tetrazona TaxID=1606681 RepID=UPI001C8A274F|nr:C-type lectin LmsL-like [Puntigrus tetrazona]
MSGAKSTTGAGLFKKNATRTRWDRDQPDNYGGDQDCVMLHPNGYWRDKSCNLKCVVICQSDEGPVLNADEEMSWKQAQRFCRENFIDLHTVRNEDDNQLLRMMSGDDQSCIWIGLYRDSWKWSDQTNTSSSLPWASKQPDNYLGDEICAAVDEDGLIADQRCSNTFFFFCRSPQETPSG